MTARATKIWERRRPFTHYHITDMFDLPTYTSLVAAAGVTTDGRQPPTQASHRYDADIWQIGPQTSARFSPLFTREFLTGVARLTGVPFHPLVEGAVHKHRAGSRTGWIHTDFCSAWFDAHREPGELQYPDPAQCDYFSGTPRSATAAPVEYVRAASLIYFVDNDGWQPGDGGETGLFEARASLDGELIPPRSNTMVVFANSPHSYHRFQELRRGSRTSIVAWLHIPAEVAVDAWGKSVTRRRPA